MGEEKNMACGLNADQANGRAPLPEDATPIEHMMPHVNKCIEGILDILLRDKGDISEKAYKLQCLLSGLCGIAWYGGKTGEWPKTVTAEDYPDEKMKSTFTGVSKNEENKQ